MDRDGVEVHKHAKKGTRPISSHLGRTSLVNKGYIIWLSGKYFLRDRSGSPRGEGVGLYSWEILTDSKLQFRTGTFS